MAGVARAGRYQGAAPAAECAALYWCRVPLCTFHGQMRDPVFGKCADARFSKTGFCCNSVGSDFLFSENVRMHVFQKCDGVWQRVQPHKSNQKRLEMVQNMK